jgi:hypothetical protein
LNTADWPPAYFTSTLLFVPAAIAIFSVRTSGRIEGERRRVNLRSIVEGIEFIWIQRIILSLFLLDFAVVLVGFYRPILPIFAADVFKTGATGLGLLYAAPSVGSLLGTIALLMAGNVKRKGVLVIIAALFFAWRSGAIGNLRNVCDGGSSGSGFGIRRFDQRGDSAYGGSALGARRHARPRRELDHRVRADHQWFRCAARRHRRPTRGRAKRIALRQRLVLLDDPRHLPRHPAAVALQVVREPVQKFQAAQFVQNVKTAS